MMLNISSTSNSPFSIEDVKLPFNKVFNVTLINIVGILKTPVKRSGIYKITTNLIQREDGNIHRILAYVYIGRNSSYINFTPTHLLKYKLRLYDFNSADITLSSESTDEKLLFTEFSCQLEVTETYGRFQ